MPVKAPLDIFFVILFVRRHKITKFITLMEVSEKPTFSLLLFSYSIIIHILFVPQYKTKQNHKLQIAN